MATEQSPLLDGQPRDVPDEEATAKAHRASRLRETAFFLWALIATAAVIVLGVWAQHNQQTSRRHEEPSSHKRNVVFMVSDGMGPASLALTRNFRQYVERLPENDTLVLDKHFWGSSRTRSSNRWVTDSAAGATAFSCGKKTYNGAIAMLPNYEPCGTVLEAAKRAGYHTGLVVTTGITDATPGSFSAHALLREMEDEIALQQVGDGVLGRTVDLMLGGGRCHFLPNTTDRGCRVDDMDVTQLAQDKYGWTYVDDRSGFDAMKGGDNVNLPFLGLFAHYDVPFEIDRRNHNDVYPSLREMSETALRALEIATADSDKGFFLMIEASRIDHAGHYNDPAAQVHEVLAYDAAFKAVLDFIAQSDTETILLATSDHETGGLATALQEPGHHPVYNWFPRVLANVSSSAEHLHSRLQSHIASLDPSSYTEEALKSWINDELIVPGLGIPNASDKELALLARSPDDALEAMADMVSLRAHLGWSTHGHSAVDVNIYSSGHPATEPLRGNVENTEIGHFLRKYLDVDIDAITDELRAKSEKPDLGVLAAQGMADAYHIEEI